MTLVKTVKKVVFSPSRVAATLTLIAATVATAVGQNEQWDTNTVVALVIAIGGIGYKWLDGRSKYETTDLAISATSKK